MWDEQNLDETVAGGLSFERVDRDDAMPYCLLEMPDPTVDRRGRTGTQQTKEVTALPVFTVFHHDDESAAASMADAIMDVYEKFPLPLVEGEYMHMILQSDGGDAAEEGDFEWLWRVQFEVKAAFKRELQTIIPR